MAVSLDLEQVVVKKLLHSADAGIMKVLGFCNRS